MDATVGQLLREAREAQNISLDDVALRLRLMHRQIEAMEADDFKSLGQPVFARGFVRNYARLLGLDADALLAQMEGAPAESMLLTQTEPPERRSWLASPWFIGLLLGLVIVVAVPVSLYLWLNSDEGEPDLAARDSQATSTSSTPPSIGLDPPGASVTAQATAIEQAATPAAAGAAPDESATETVADEADPLEAAGGTIRLEFAGDAWVEIKDATGRVLHRQINPADTSLNIQGRPPFAVVIGNATQTRMTYNGRPIDLKPFIDVSVARFTLEE